METTDHEATPVRVATTLELEEIEGSLHGNADLAPTSKLERRWGLKDIAALWVSMSACIPTYMLASSLIAEGMSWWQAVLTIFLGNCVVLAPMVLNAHAGTKYGIPFPVYCRPAFGILGANVPAVLRALVACGWFGIQSWIGGDAIYKVLRLFFHGWETLPTSDKTLDALLKAGVDVAPLDAWMATRLGLN
ncbi:MAG: cytosine permease, partial [Isosphaeraceae bacterium]